MKTADAGAPGAFFTLTMQCWTLGWDMAQVITLRLMRVAAGGTLAQREMRRMVEEKAAAHAALAVRMGTGSLGQTPLTAVETVLRHYSGTVRANRRRLNRR